MEQLTQLFNNLNLTEGLMGSVVVVLVISLISVRRQQKIQHQQSLSMQSLQRDLRALANAAVGVGGRVLEIERNQRQHLSTTTQSKSSQKNTSTVVDYYSSSNTQPYEQAINMAQTGASVEDIMNVCGLSQSEAELVNMMHRLDKAS